MLDNPQFLFPDISFEEMAFLKQAVVGLSDTQMQSFNMIYSGKRKREQDVQLYCILGLLVIPGLQRFMTGRAGWNGYLIPIYHRSLLYRVDS